LNNDTKSTTTPDHVLEHIASRVNVASYELVLGYCLSTKLHFRSSVPRGQT
jgi:hypothetical protein